jgi:hypothetical protein
MGSSPPPACPGGAVLAGIFLGEAVDGGRRGVEQRWEPAVVPAGDEAVAVDEARELVVPGGVERDGSRAGECRPVLGAMALCLTIRCGWSAGGSSRG